MKTKRFLMQNFLLRHRFAVTFFAGICIGTGCNEKTVVNGRTISTMFLKMQNTDFELPLSESDLRELVNYIKERCQSHKMP